MFLLEFLPEISTNCAIDGPLLGKPIDSLLPFLEDA